MAVFTSALMGLRVAKQFFLSNLVVAVGALTMLILYLVSARKISAALAGDAGQRISSLARRVAGCLACVLLANVAYIVSPVIVPETNFVPNVTLSVVILNFFQPLAYCGKDMILLKFLLDASKRNKVRPGSGRSLAASTAVVPSATTTGSTTAGWTTTTGP